MDDSKDRKTPAISKNQRPWFLCLVIIVAAFLEYRANHWLPDTLHRTDTSDNRFEVENAKSHLKALTDLGPRVVGSQTTEIKSPHLLIKLLKEIQSKAPGNVLIEIDEQHPSSHFHLDFLGGMNNVYSNVTNVVAKISWFDTEGWGPLSFPDPKSMKNTMKDDFSLLINAHYDSVPGSPGAADDGIGVACMLEVLRVLSQGPKLERPVVFLFNGAEEANHQAAHGFITQHKWAPKVKYLMNLEAIGSGGHEMVFQCNSGWLANVYVTGTPYPHTQVIAHELFKNFLHRVASTDWSTIIKFGTPGMKGIDTAYIENGYVYHTTFDSIDIIPDGTFLNTGENILQLTRTLSTATILNENTQENEISKSRDESSVFFDTLGVALIVYSGIYVYIFHTIAVVIGLFTIYTLAKYVRPLNIKLFSKILLDELICIWLPALLTAIIGIMMYFIAPMRWYNGGINVAYLLYIPTAIFFTVLVRGYMTKRTHNNYIMRQISCITMFVVIAVPFIIFNIMSGFIFCLWIVFTSGACLVQLYVKRYQIRNYNIKKEHALNLVNSGSSNYNNNNNTINSSNSIHSSNSSSKLDSPIHKSNKNTISNTNENTNGNNNDNWKNDQAAVYCDILDPNLASSRYLYSPEFFYTLCISPMILTWIQTIHLTFTMLIPLLGKSGTTTPSDPLLGLLFGLLIALPAGCILNNEVKRPLTKNSIYGGLLVLLLIYINIMVNYPSSYSNLRPKRLWIQHVERYSVDRESTGVISHTDNKGILGFSENIPLKLVDSGVWVSAFDSNGMSPLKELHLALLEKSVFPPSSVENKEISNKKSSLMNQKSTSCEDYQGDCYYSFPWYFPVAEALKDSVYLKSAHKPVIPEKQRLKLTTKVTELTRDFCDHIVCDDQIKTLLIGMKDYRSNKHENDHHKHGYRLIDLTLTGPSHLHIVLRDNAHGKHIKLWRINHHEKVKVNKNAVQNEVQNEVQGEVSTALTAVNSLIDFELPSPVRAEGIHYFQIGFGLCEEGVCKFTLQVIVKGTDKVDIAAYGHYVDITNDSGIAELLKTLPDWSKGAEWTNFPSIIITDSV